LPDWLGGLTELRYLSVTGCQLSEVPASLAGMTELTGLFLDSNQLTDLPDWLAGLSELRTFVVSHNQLTGLPTWIGGLAELTCLGVSGANLGTLPDFIRDLTALRELRLGMNGLSQLPDWLPELAGLITLKLSGNRLSRLPKGISKLRGLTELDLSSNQFTTLPILATLTGLRSLHLENNRLVGPPWLSRLGGLEKLFLGGLRTSLAPFLGTMTGLKTLAIDDCKLTELPGWLSGLTGLRDLYVENNMLTELPDWVADLTELTQLSLVDNRLTEVPACVRALTGLRGLYLRNNELTEIPDWLAELTGLNWLWLNGNHLLSLPTRIGELTGLVEIIAGGNNLAAVPVELANLPGLIGVYLQHNLIESLPDPWCTGLSYLNLAHNKLTDMPSCIARMHNLVSLDLSANLLTELPDWFVDFAGIDHLGLSGNPLVSPPPETAASGTESILSFIRARRQGSVRQWVSKLLVVGEGGVGKTSLVKALADLPHDPDEPTTHGLNIRDLPFDHPYRDDVTMSLTAWDFGGQQIYHATHQFFLTDRSLFVLLWNSRLGWEQGKLRYWLDIITARAPESPILLVATHAGDRPVDLPLDDLRAEYPMIAGNLIVDSAAGLGVVQLRALVAELAADLPLMGSEWPSTWLAAASALRGSPQDHVTPGQMWRMMAEAGVSDADQRRYIAVALHQLGDILFYHDDPELAQTVVLHPEWVNEYISKVLDSEQVAACHGLLTHTHLAHLWDDLDRGMRDHLLGMMDRYDLSYQIQGGSAGEVSQVVEQLPWNPPDYQADWAAAADSHEIRLLYRLNTMPPGIPTWFIARSHRFSTGKHWRTGAMLAHPDGKHVALARADRHRNVLELAVRGPSPSAFFSVLDDGLNMTLDRFPGLHIQRQVPCPCQSDCPELYDYEDLRSRLARTPPKDTIECRKSGEDIAVQPLLLGISPSERDATRMGIEQISRSLRQLNDQMSGQTEYTQRMFVKLQRLLQNQQESRCPSVFAIVPSDRKRLLGTAYELRLYCEEPGAWHRLPEPAGCYPIVEHAEWLRRFGPYLKYLLEVLKHAAPLVGPVLGVSVGKLDEHLKADCELMKELVSQLPERFQEERRGRLTAMSPTAQAGTDADFRALTAMLSHLDPDRTWGGLSRTTTPEGLTLYLCRDHLAAYQSPPSIS
jgi:Leucine-rich repeat (LRR) protein